MEALLPVINPGPSSSFLRDLKEEFCAPGSEGDILPCEAPIASLFGDYSMPTEGYLPGEFDPRGLQKTYWDYPLKLELPTFAVINVRRPGHRIKIQKQIENSEASFNPEGAFQDLDNSHTPKCHFLHFHKGLKAYQKRKSQSTWLLWGATLLTATLGACLTLIPSIGNIWAQTQTLPIPVPNTPLLPALLLAFGFGFVANRIGHRIREDKIGTLEEEVRFNLQGYLPNSIRETLKEKLVIYEDVYLICDARGQWESQGTTIVDGQKRRELDPLIIGERKGKFYLLGWFDLTDPEKRIVTS